MNAVTLAGQWAWTKIKQQVLNIIVSGATAATVDGHSEEKNQVIIKETIREIVKEPVEHKINIFSIIIVIIMVLAFTMLGIILVYVLNKLKQLSHKYQIKKPRSNCSDSVPWHV